MDYYPIFLDIRNRDCLVVGGGSVAARKIALLLRAGAQVQVVSTELNADLRQHLAQGRLQQLSKSFQPAMVAGKTLVIAATDNGELNAQVAHAAQLINVPVNVVDQPALCSFISPAIVDRNPLLIAISSAGTAPVLVRQLRQRLEQWLPARLGGLAAWAGRVRTQIKQQIKPPLRRRFWERFFFGPIAQHWLAGREQQAQTALIDQLTTADSAKQAGEVYLVGAGPGHPDLLTLRALQLMQQADVILHDRLVSAAVLERARRDAERVFVGKASGCHHKTQHQINELMVTLARQGKRVCRLKGGDPLIFGRGGEEAEYLAEHNITYQIVPGITAATACAAYAGIPLTHRHNAHGVQIVTGHINGQRAAEDWQRLATSGQTLVFYMALERLDEVVAGLRQHGGAPAETPVAVIEKGTLPQQQVICGTLGNISIRLQAAQIGSPALLIIGPTCALSDKLRWFRPEVASSQDIGSALLIADAL